MKSKFEIKDHKNAKAFVMYHDGVLMATFYYGGPARKGDVRKGVGAYKKQFNQSLKK